MKRLYTTRQAAEYLGYSNQTMKRSRVDGELSGIPAPAHLKINRSIRYKKEDLDAWVDKLEAIT